MQIDRATAGKRERFGRENLPVVGYYEQVRVERGQLHARLLGVDILGIDDGRPAPSGFLAQRSVRSTTLPRTIARAESPAPQPSVACRTMPETSAPQTDRCQT